MRVHTPLSSSAAGALMLAASLTSMGCAAPSPKVLSPEMMQPSVAGPGFDYPTLDGAHLSRPMLAGRTSIIGFVTTYDIVSQAQVRFLTALFRQHRPRINVAILVLEPVDNRPLIETYVSTMKVPFPVAIADAETIAGQGPFGALHHVPSVLVLNAKGEEVYRNLGLVEQEALEDQLRKAEASDSK